MAESLYIDMGNSPYCKVAFTENGRMKPVLRTEKGRLAEEVRQAVKNSGKLGTICLSSVCNTDPELLRILERSCENFINLNGLTPGLPISLDYGTPHTLGADRIAAAAGAAALFPEDNCLVFDFGTAITIDFVTKDGHFKGGNISPGMNMRFEAIHHYTNKLPLVKPSIPDAPEGRDTASAINNGVILGIMFEVEKYLENHRDCKIVFTGGDALFFAKRLKSPIFVVCNLVFIGLAHIASIKTGNGDKNR